MVTTFNKTKNILILKGSTMLNQLCWWVIILPFKLWIGEVHALDPPPKPPDGHSMIGLLWIAFLLMAFALWVAYLFRCRPVNPCIRSICLFCWQSCNPATQEMSQHQSYTPLQTKDRFTETDAPPAQVSRGSQAFPPAEATRPSAPLYSDLLPTPPNFDFEWGDQFVKPTAPPSVYPDPTQLPELSVASEATQIGPKRDRGNRDKESTPKRPNDPNDRRSGASARALNFDLPETPGKKTDIAEQMDTISIADRDPGEGTSRGPGLAGRDLSRNAIWRRQFQIDNEDLDDTLGEGTTVLPQDELDDESIFDDAVHNAVLDQAVLQAAVFKAPHPPGHQEGTEDSSDWQTDTTESDMDTTGQNTEGASTDNEESARTTAKKRGPGRPKGRKNKSGRKNTDIGRGTRKSRNDARHRNAQREARNEASAASRARTSQSQTEEQREAERVRNTSGRQSRRSQSNLFKQRELVTKELLKAHRNQKKKATYRGAVTQPTMMFLETDDPHHLHDIHDAGLRSRACPNCKALLYSGEFPKKTNKNKIPQICCSGGKVNEEPYPDPPDPLDKLYAGTHEHSQHFKERIRMFNHGLTLCSLEANPVPPPPGGGVCAYKVQGRTAHRISAYMLDPNEPNRRKRYLQIYFTGGETELKLRMEETSVREPLDKKLLLELQLMLHQHNQYVCKFKSLVELHNAEDVQVIVHASKYRPGGTHSRTYNRSTVRECAVIMMEGDEPLSKQDLILHMRKPTNSNREVHRVKATSRAYDPLFYVLLFPYGSPGYDLELNSPEPGEEKVSFLSFYRFHLHERKDSLSHLLRAGMLTQQWVTEIFARWQQGVLDWCKNHQKELRAEKYSVVVDAIARNRSGVEQVDPIDLGRKTILPATITGTPRFYRATYFDAMCIVRKLGKPSYFLTMTCNPGWKEVQDELKHGEIASDRPDLCARVFHIKMRELLDDILKKQILGHVISHFYTVEFQKRGLPHIHLLLIMAEEDKPNSALKSDLIISAEIPDRSRNPRLHSLVVQHMLHGPCGRDFPRCPCMQIKGQDLTCSKQFPKEFAVKTRQDGESYPIYRRRSPDQGGQEYVKQLSDHTRFVFDNRWVVPYNPALLLRYNCHLNVEVVHCLQAVKYLYKYITKGNDRQVFSVRRNPASDTVPEQVIRENDEIADYEDGRYVSASEAFWRIYGFEIHEKYPPVSTLVVHAENEQSVMFNLDSDSMMNAAVAGSAPGATKLLAYFDFVEKNGEMAADLRYVDMPRYCTWETKASDRGWKWRKSGIKDEKGRHLYLHLGRMPYFAPSGQNRELFHIRLLLAEKPARSFEDLRTVDGQVCSTFQEACVKLGLLDDDHEQEEVMREVSVAYPPHVVRLTFVCLLMHCTPACPKDLLDNHIHSMAEDIYLRYTGGQRLDHEAEVPPAVYHGVLAQLEEMLERNNRTLQAYDLPKVDKDLVPDRLSAIIGDETVHNFDELKRQVQDTEPTLTMEQNSVYQSIVTAVDLDKPTVFMVDACGGSGKTYVLNLVLRKLRSRHDVALATAFSGIAATLLDKGRTLHGRFKVPIPCDTTDVCNFTTNSDTGKLMRLAKLLIVDEVTMGDRYIYECIDRTLRDVRKDSRPFGGMTVVFAGDFRQILPVLPKGQRPQIIKLIIKRSEIIWPVVQTLTMVTNMRAQLAGGDVAQHAEFLLELGEGRLERHTNVPAYGEFRVRIPDRYIMAEDEGLEQLIDYVFDGFMDVIDGDRRRYMDPQWICSRAILCPRNQDVDEVNKKLLRRFDDPHRVYLSSNWLIEEDEDALYPVEMLQNLKHSGFPPHQLSLRINSPIMLVRNLDAPAGHVNGARYIVKRLAAKHIWAERADGSGVQLTIPRIDFISDKTAFPFSFKRRQFPVRLAYGITTNKSQGQTLQRCGLWLPSHLFAHGQLYVAMSRVGHPKDIKVLIKDSKVRNEVGAEEEGQYTDNVVYREALE